jgi:GNAT superfamily N-acetyltransferase
MDGQGGNMSELNVRIGTPDDLDPVMELALRACSENGFVDPNPVKLLSDIWPALNLDRGMIGIIGEVGQKPEAAVLLRIGSMWYSDNEVLEEKAVFVQPEHRGAKVGRARRLCQFSKQVSDQLGIPLIIGVLSNHRTKGKVRLYEREFGEPSGAFFLYNARTGLRKEAAE